MALTICQTVDLKAGILVGTYGNGVYQVHADGTSMPAYSGNRNVEEVITYSVFLLIAMVIFGWDVWMEIWLVSLQINII